MTAPVQMTHSSTGALVEPRGLRRAGVASNHPSADVLSSDASSARASSSKTQSSKAQFSKAQSSNGHSFKAKAEDVSDTDETADLGGSMNSVETDDSTDHSSFGAILRKYVATPSVGGGTSQSNQTDTSQQKKDSVTPDPLSPVPDQPMGKYREVLPMRLSLLSPDTPPAAPDQDSTNAPVNSSHTGSVNTGAIHAALDLALPPPVPPQTAHANPDARTAENTPASQPQSEQSQATAAQTVTLQTSQPETLQTEPAHVEASQGPAAPEPESTAFAVRLTPSTPAAADQANTKAAEASSLRPQANLQTSSQFTQKEMPAPDATASAAQPADSAADRLAMINTMPHLAHAATQNETVSSAPKSEVHPLPTPSALRAEPVNNPPAAPSSSSRDFTVRIPDATDRGTNVRFVERGSEVHVSVRTSDSELAQLLRGGLGDLTGRLQHNGVQAEMWRPGSDPSHSDSQSQSSESKDQGGRRHQSGAQSDGQDQPREDKPRWVEELESFGEPVGR